MAWERLLAKPSSERRILVDLTLAQTREGLSSRSGTTGVHARVPLLQAHDPARDAKQAEAQAKDALGKLGDTIFEAAACAPPGAGLASFRPASSMRCAVRHMALEAARASDLRACPAPRRSSRPWPYPRTRSATSPTSTTPRPPPSAPAMASRSLKPPTRATRELGDVPLMITKHCVRFSLSLCPKRAKGVTGVQGHGACRAHDLAARRGPLRAAL